MSGHKNLDERLGEIRHVEVKLGNVEPHQPNLRLFASVDDGNATVVLVLASLHGQQQRFAEMSPTLARSLASKLLAMADAVDAEVRETAEAMGGVS